jgi:hypothetical protein
MKSTSSLSRRSNHCVVDPAGDLTVTVTGPVNEEGKRNTVTFKVSSKKLEDHCGPAGYFRKSMQFNVQNGHSEVKLLDDNWKAMRVWFEYMHKKHLVGYLLIRSTSILTGGLRTGGATIISSPAWISATCGA